jgi:putative transposase
MTRQPSPSVAQRNAALVQRIRALKAAHPFWGYRRLWAYLRFVEWGSVNKKRIRRLMREHELLVTPNRQLQAKRTPPRSKPKPTRPNEWWGIAMTKVLVQSFGWVDIVVVLDWYTKTIVGHDAGRRGTAQHWLLTLAMAVDCQCPEGAQGKGSR